jgi:hypothetical protein
MVRCPDGYYRSFHRIPSVADNFKHFNLLAGLSMEPGFFMLGQALWLAQATSRSPCSLLCYF